MSFFRKPAQFSVFLIVLIACFILLYRVLNNQSRWRYIVVHHTASKKGNLKSIRRIHMSERNWPDVAYHFIINNGTMGTDMGQVEVSNLWLQGRGNFATLDSEINQQSIAIALVGNFQKTSVPPGQWQALKNLVTQLAAEHLVQPENIKGHREVSSSVCPGKNLSVEKLRSEVRLELKKALQET